MRLPTLLIAAALVISQPARAASRDADVMAAVFAHFASRTDTMSAHENGLTLVRSKTQRWSVEQLRVLSLERVDKPCEIPAQLYADFAGRNRSDASAKQLVRTSRKWRLARPGEEQAHGSGRLGKTSTGEPIKTVARVSYPAYSPNRDQALVMFYFRWSMHSALAQYVLAKSGGGWKINCSQLRFYP